MLFAVEIQQGRRNRDSEKVIGSSKVGSHRRTKKNVGEAKVQKRIPRHGIYQMLQWCWRTVKIPLDSQPMEEGEEGAQKVALEWCERGKQPPSPD